MEVFGVSLIRNVFERKKMLVGMKNFQGRDQKFRPEVMRAWRRDAENR